MLADHFRVSCTSQRLFDGKIGWLQPLRRQRPVCSTRRLRQSSDGAVRWLPPWACLRDWRHGETRSSQSGRRSL